MATFRARCLATGALIFLGAGLICSAVAIQQPGQVAPGQVTPGQPTPGQVAPGQTDPPNANPAPKPAQPAPDQNALPLGEPSRTRLSDVVGPPIQFESHGLQYESITHGGITLMCAVL